MSLRELFNNNPAATKVSRGSLSDLTSTYDLESVGVLSSSLSEYDLLLPHLDFSKPENFAKYGSAEKYYEGSIKKICNTYPYDGSKKQKLEWRKNASYLDLYLFEQEYPKYTGSINLGTTYGTIVDSADGYFNTPARIERIKVPVGLATGTIYDEDTNRESCFSFARDGGFCVEFWLNNSAWMISTASYQVILHAENHGLDFTDKWGFLVYVNNTDIGIALDNTINPVSVGTAVLAAGAPLGQWNHFAFNVTTGTIDIWKNGYKQSTTDASINWPTSTLRELRFTGSIGAFGSDGWNSSYGGNSSTGGNKLSGSLDDIRFWRAPRTDKEIKTNWFTTVDGGFDQDELLTPKLGWYYKFNEGTTYTSSIDAQVLDYSGRKNNGTWVGYTDGARVITSPIENEVKDPLTHFSSSAVYGFYSAKLASGSFYDNENNGAMRNQIPSYIEEEDKDNHWGNLSQIVASMFDRLWFQINALTSIKDTTYFASGSFPSSILLTAIRSNGLNIEGLLDDYSLSELINQKTDTFSLENSIESIKQTIYKNIYNNMIYIMKTKGTDKAIKSVFRAFGVDDDVLKIKAYSKESKIEIDGSKRKNTVRRKNMLDLSGETDGQNMYGNLFNQYIPNQSSSIGYMTHSTYNDVNIGYFDKTIEANILFPHKFNSLDANHVYFPAANLSASLFGLYQINDAIVSPTSVDSTWATNGYKLNVYSVQRNRDSKDAKFVFVLTGSTLHQIYTETNWFEDVYDNTKWTFGVKFHYSGTQNVENYRTKPYLTNNDNRTQSISIIGINEIAGNIIDSFSSTTDIYYPVQAYANEVFYGKSKAYVGAIRTNFTGAVVTPTQAKFLSFRVWNDVLNDQDVINHAYDAHNFGIHSASWNYRSYQNSTEPYDSGNQLLRQSEDRYIPRAESLIVNWDFENEYTPDSNGIFTVSSFRSASIYSEDLRSMDGYANPLGYIYSAIGYGFNSGSTVIDKNYVIEQKNRIPTDYYSYDDISLVDDSELYFGRQIKPVEYFYTIENSIYDVISEDILNMFSSIIEFNDLIGRPVERYRTEYKDLRIMRELFFSKIQNTTIDVDKYFSYYRWLDATISVIIHKLLPLSANADAGVRNIIESHVLERNKYVWHSQFVRSKHEKKLEGIIRNTNFGIPRRPLR